MFSMRNYPFFKLDGSDLVLNNDRKYISWSFFINNVTVLYTSYIQIKLTYELTVVVFKLSCKFNVIFNPGRRSYELTNDNKKCF